MHIRERHERLQAIERPDKQAGSYQSISVIVERSMQNGWEIKINELLGPKISGLGLREVEYMTSLKMQLTTASVRGIMSKVVTKNKHTEQTPVIANGEQSDWLVQSKDQLSAVYARLA